MRRAKRTCSLTRCGEVPRPSQNVYSECHQCREIQGSFVFPSEKQCRDALAHLSDESSTGPDFLSAQILKSCAEQLAKPLQLLLLHLLNTANWPESWGEHWIVPIYKKSRFFSASNYRGVHLTAQLSKVAERLLLPMLETHISHTVAFGPKQFVHTKGRGARDALAYLMMSLIPALNRHKKVAVCCSDVSGALTGNGLRDFWRNSDAFTLPWSIWRGPGCSNDPLRCSWKANDRTRCSSGTWCARAPRLDPHSGTCSTRMLGVLSTRQGSWKSSMLTTRKGSGRSNTMSASIPSCQRPRSVNPSCTSRVKRTRSRSIQRRNPSTSCPTATTRRLIKIALCHIRLYLCVREMVSQASWKLTTNPQDEALP